MNTPWLQPLPRNELEEASPVAAYIPRVNTERPIRWLSAVAAVSGQAWFLLWLFAPPSFWPVIASLIRPDASCGILGCAVALIAHLNAKGRKGLYAIVVGSSAIAIISGVALAGSPTRRAQSVLFVLLRPELAAVPCTMAPFAAIALIATTAAALLLMADARPRFARAAAGINLATAGLCAGFLFAASFRLVAHSEASPNRLMLPGAAASLLIINIVYLMGNKESEFGQSFVGDHPAAIVARRLMGLSGASLLLFGLVGVVFQHVGAITIEEQTALLTACAFSLLVSVLFSHARVVRQLLSSKMEHVQVLKAALSERKDMVSDLGRERSHLASILRAATGFGVIATDLEGNITLFSLGAEKLLGLAAKDVVGQQNVLTLHDAGELKSRAEELGVAPSFDVLRALPRLGMVEERTWHYIGHGGRRVPVRVSVSSMRNAAGQETGYVGIARDITADLRLEQDRDGLLRIGQELLCVCSIDGLLLNTSPSFARVFGYERSELIGQPFLKFVHPADVPATQRLYASILAGAPCERFENRWRARDGRYRYISWDALVAADGSHVYAGGWDLTEEKARARKMEELLAAEKHLIGIVSHDLRNPISAIAMSAELIKRQHPEDAKLQRRSEQIAHACARAERLIHDVLDFTEARLGQGLRIQPAPTDLLALTNKTVEEVQIVYPQRQVDVLAAPLGLLPLDRDRMGQVLQNLLTNAMKYGPTGSPVTVTVGERQTAAMITVHNGGPAIAPSLLPNLFKPLRRSDDATNQHDGSIGLGLYIVHEIVSAHGGTIDVESTSELGTTFSIVLPKSLEISREAADEAQSPGR